ncbi:multidrug DMT transporter permease [Gardnerella pickettii]|uniref:Multidrug DMT transporter permease n=1 Tax=Gardnerella pickettii TaxID=2914924 RepID=A0ABX4SLE2_9BIFI|nr:FtsX-like permease family protein [Gardnerella pickettii]PKZ54821.1 multidrug DMT transporter permease [Gardnerella pickettii]
MIQIIKRAWLAIVRKPRRSAILALIVTVVLSALICQASVIACVKNLENQITSNIGLGFSVYAKTQGQTLPESDSAGDPTGDSDSDSVSDSSKQSQEDIPQDLQKNEGIPESLIAKFKKISGIKTSAEEKDVLANPVNAKIVAPINGPRLDNDGMFSLVSITGTTKSQLAQGFQEGLYKLEEGNHIDSSVAGDFKRAKSAIIHKSFAKQNNLKLGSVLTLKQGSKSVNLKVVGIFSGKMQTKGALPSDSSENRVITDLESALYLFGSKNRSSIKCVMQNSNNLEKALKEANKIAKNYGNGMISVENNAQRFASVLQSVKTVKQLVTMILMCLALVGIIVLGLVLVFWVRGRIHEVGVLMAIGVEKRVIALQMIIEVFIITAFCSLMSTAISGAISSSVGSMLLANVANGAITYSSNQSLLTGQTAFSILLGFAIAFASLCIAFVPIMLKKPRSILSSIS